MVWRWEQIQSKANQPHTPCNCQRFASSQLFDIQLVPKRDGRGLAKKIGQQGKHQNQVNRTWRELLKSNWSLLILSCLLVFLGDLPFLVFWFTAISGWIHDKAQALVTLDTVIAQVHQMMGKSNVDLLQGVKPAIRSMYIWLLIKIPLSRNGHSSRITILLSRNFRELHVYLSRGPCWPTTPLMKIRSPPAKLRQRITDHFLVAF